MILNEPADRCCAVVVGIEKYDAGPTWTLHGPAADALRFVAWLAKHNMPASNIRVFLSLAEDRVPLRVDGVTLKDESSGFQIELPGGTTIAVEPATQERIRQALINPGWAPSTKALILFWGGHGVLRDTSDERYLYCANARGGDEIAINITEQLRYLRSTQFSQWRQQVVFIDACAELLSARGKAVPTLSLPETDYQLNPEIEQWVLNAAAIGKLAINLGHEGTGKFSKALFELFGATGIEALPVSSSGWPNFGTVAERMEERFEGNTQCPVLFIADKEGVRRTVNGSVLFRQEQGLIYLLNSLRSVDLDRVQRAYRMATVRVPDPPSTPDSTVAVVRVLASFVQVETGLNLLERFVAKLYLLVAAGGHVEDGAKLWDWLEHHVQDQPALRAFLAREAAAPGTVAHLLIDVPPTNSALSVRAWLFRPGQVIATWSGVQTGTPDLATSLGAALNWAITLYGEDELVVELMVPHELLDAGLDRETVPLPTEEGMGDEKRTLGVDYVTYLRLRERGLGRASSRLTAEWKRAAQRVFAGFRQVGPFDICWMHLSDGVCHVDLSSESPWIGLTCAARSTKVSPRPLDAVLSRGAPLVVWPVKDPANETEFRRCVEMLLRPTNLDALPATLKATMQGQAPDFTLMVDTPDRLPPERLDGDPTQRTSV